MILPNYQWQLNLKKGCTLCIYDCTKCNQDSKRLVHFAYIIVPIASNSPSILHVCNAKFQQVFAHVLISHGHESSTTQHKICLIAFILISYYHLSSGFATQLRIQTSHLQNYIHTPNSTYKFTQTIC